MTVAFSLALLLLSALLALVSYTSRLYAEMGRFLSREFQENIEVFEQKVEKRLGVSSERAALSMAVLEHLTTAAIVLLVGHSVFSDGQWSAMEITQATVSIVLIIVLFNRLAPFVLFARTRGEWLVGLAPVLRVLIYLAFPVTLLVGFGQSVASLGRHQAEPEPERPSEAVDALIEAGQEEGILEESDRELVQSAIEFGDKTVREVMTARPEVFAVPLSTTVEQFTEMLRQRPFSRVPVYEDTLDNIRGIVLAHDILQVPDTEARTRTVRDLMRTDVHYVPEMKSVSDLLREMQKDNVHMAMVIDEYGGLAGVVTMEDLVEEIVGEIRDEHEAKTEIIREKDGSYIVPGNMDVDHLDHLFGVRPEGHDATTVAGLVTELLGRIPHRGEVVTDDGLRFEVLDSTDRRVERLRIGLQSSRRQELRA